MSNNPKFTLNMTGVSNNSKSKIQNPKFMSNIIGVSNNSKFKIQNYYVK
jgi:hypothetical protein